MTVRSIDIMHTDTLQVIWRFEDGTTFKEFLTVPPKNVREARQATQCEGRYPVPQTSPPRDEPFEVTYRCGRLNGHRGPCGPSDPEQVIDRTQENASGQKM